MIWAQKLLFLYLSKNGEVNPIFMIFNRINYTNFSQLNEGLISIQNYHKAEVKINTLWLAFRSVEYLDTILNPEYLKDRVMSIQIYFSYVIEITEKTLLSISEIKPKEISFNVGYHFDSFYNFIDILSNLWEEIKVNFEINNFKSFHLTFTNAFIKIFDSITNRSAVFKCKSFKWAFAHSEQMENIIQIKKMPSNGNLFYFQINKNKSYYIIII